MIPMRFSSWVTTVANRLRRSLAWGWMRERSASDLAGFALAITWFAFLMFAEPIGPNWWPDRLTWSNMQALVDKSIFLMAMMAAATPGKSFISRVGWFVGSVVSGVAGYWIEIPLYSVVVHVALMHNTFTNEMPIGNAAPFFTGWLTVGSATNFCRLLVAVMILMAAMGKLKAKEAVC